MSFITSQDALRKRDLILEEALAVLSDSDLADSLIFQGGGALHFIFSSPRYSDDLDFVDPTITNRADAYAAKLREVGSRFPKNSVKVVSSGRGVRAKWGYEDNTPHAKVEVDARGPGYHKLSEGKFPILVKTPTDIYADKIVATVSRYSNRDSSEFPFKPADLFDLDYIVTTLGCEPASREHVIARAADFNCESIVTPENIAKIIALIVNKTNHPFFNECLKKTMLPDVYALQKFDEDYFRKAAEHFKRYV